MAADQIFKCEKENLKKTLNLQQAEKQRDRIHEKVKTLEVQTEMDCDLSNKRAREDSTFKEEILRIYLSSCIFSH